MFFRLQIFKSFLYFRYIKLSHVSNLTFHKCKEKKHFLKWKRVIGRMDSGFTVGPNTCVCSNHFKYAMSTHESPHPSLFMKGYPGISKRSENPKTPPRRILQRNGSSVVKKPRKTLCKRTVKHKTELRIRDKENRESQPTSESGCQHEDEVKLDECYPSNISPIFLTTVKTVLKN